MTSYNDDDMSNGMELHRATVSDIYWLTDSYKVRVHNPLPWSSVFQVSHHLQYPPGTTNVYSYFESRGGLFQETCFFGLQYILKRWMTGPVVRLDNIKEAVEFYAEHFGRRDVFNEEGFKYIAEVCDACLCAVMRCRNTMATCRCASRPCPRERSCLCTTCCSPSRIPTRMCRG
jgi:hypothetical protein